MLFCRFISLGIGFCFSQFRCTSPTDLVDVMGSKHLKGIFQDRDRWAASYQIYAAKTDMLDVFSEWVDRVFEEAVVRRIEAQPDGEGEIRVLGVGSGDGELDYLMLKKVMQRFPRVNNRVVEPTRGLLDQYKALVQSKVRELHGVVCDWRQQTIEEYEKAGDSTKFHFINAVHCLYFVDNLQSSLTYLCDRLAPGGVMLIVIISDDSGWVRFGNHFPCLRELPANSVNSAGIRNCLDRNGIPYVQYNLPTDCDITQCFDQASESGSLLIDSLTQVCHFRKTAPRDLQTSVMEHLAKEKRTGGKVLLDVSEHAIVICKPLNE